MDSLISAIIGHLVGDYLLQNDWMAKGKKTNILICAVHCLIWTTCVMAFAGWGPEEGWRSCVAFFVLYELHLIQDKTQLVQWWMRKMGQREFMRCDELVVKREGHNAYEAKIKVGLGPWSIIVVDNVWHVVQIWAVAKFIIG